MLGHINVMVSQLDVATSVIIEFIIHILVRFVPIIAGVLLPNEPQTAALVHDVGQEHGQLVAVGNLAVFENAWFLALQTDGISGYNHTSIDFCKSNDSVQNYW
jgi:hypothetical protein